jgi:hypothetical protein
MHQPPPLLTLVTRLWQEDLQCALPGGRPVSNLECIGLAPCFRVSGSSCSSVHSGKTAALWPCGAPEGSKGDGPSPTQSAFYSPSL